MNILIVDDERAQLESLRRGLRSQRHKTIEVSNGADAMQILNTATPVDLVITDYAMPGMDGIKLLEEIRKERYDLPVIMMTAFGDKQIVVRALREHCNGYIEKPFTLVQLMSEIKKVNAYQSHQKGSYSDTICRMAHQINNPLMAIIGSAELGLDEVEEMAYPKETRVRLQNIIGASKRIQQINREIMGLGRIMADHPAPVDLLELMDQCLDMYADLLKKEMVTITLEAEDQSFVANVSSFGLEQVFKNMILNAVEAMQGRDGKQIRIAFGLDEEKRQIEISIEDTGVGIESAKLSKIFEPHYTNKPQGNGVGLAVVKHVIEQFDGRIHVRSWPGEGSHFLISLPTM